jgi:tyrosyl-tRNA synthetase
MDRLDEDTYWDVDGAFGDEYDEVSYGSDSEYFHIKNMKILQNYILEFKKHPVKTEKEEIKKDLANDVREFEKEFESVLKSQEMLSEMFNSSDISTAKCEEESKGRGIKIFF